jgi:hypothetical protein
MVGSFDLHFEPLVFLHFLEQGACVSLRFIDSDDVIASAQGFLWMLHIPCCHHAAINRINP